MKCLSKIITFPEFLKTNLFPNPNAIGFVFFHICTSTPLYSDTAKSRRAFRGIAFLGQYLMPCHDMSLYFGEESSCAGMPCQDIRADPLWAKLPFPPLTYPTQFRPGHTGMKWLCNPSEYGV